MRRSIGVGLFAVTIGGLLSAGWPVDAEEHGGATPAPAAQEHGGTTHEHGGQEHGGQAVKAEPSAEQIRQTIKSYVQDVAQQQGAFSIKDSVTGATRQLEFVRVHERVGKTGSLYYSCTDMRDTQTGELLDLDFDVKAEAEQLSVVDQRIHKVAGQARYTYDEHDNRIPVHPEGSRSTQ
jgi:hypothetical protein